MAFKVTFSSLPDQQLGDGDIYDFRDGGVLVVKGVTATETQYYAPGTWRTVLAGHDHEPGSAKGPG